MTKRQKIEQKIILDLRYFCDEEMEDGKCREPFTQINAAVEQLLKSHSIGGIILFGQNIEDIEQTVTLTHELQRAASKNTTRIPLLITTDQEGGTVTRLPQGWSSGMAGNMAIGAVPVSLQQGMAHDVGLVIGQELRALGINTNHAPALDVNVDPTNPVINVRSFSDQPKVVAKLGLALSAGLLEAGVAPTLKHFPGHGDTHVDSHIGLPLVAHDRQTVDALDLLPFKTLIDGGKAPLIMTAHIQYPALDSSTIKGKDGHRLIRPATFSRKIITDLLRHELHYEGVIVSDSLLMYAITRIADPADAVVTAFAAGVDMAEMPVRIRSMQDVERFSLFVTAVAEKTDDGVELDASVERILKLKDTLQFGARTKRSLGAKLSAAKAFFERADRRYVEEALAKSSVTLLKAAGTRLQLAGKAILIVMPTRELAASFKAALSTRLGGAIEAYAVGDLSPTTIDGLIDAAAVILAGNITPPDGPVDLGAMDDHLGDLNPQSKITLVLGSVFRSAAAKGKKTVFISLKFPTDAMSFMDQVDAAYALYNSRTYSGVGGVPSNASIEALAEILAQKSEAVGHLPMRMDTTAARGGN